MKSSSPRWPSSWPLFAVNTTGRVGPTASSARSVSSQHTIPPPRSAVDCHQELRGVMTTSGAAVAVLARGGTERDDDIAGGRGCSAALGDEPGRIAAGRGREHLFPRRARHVDCRHAERFAERLGVEQPHARALPGAKDNETAVPAR